MTGITTHSLALLTWSWSYPNHFPYLKNGNTQKVVKNINKIDVTFFPVFVCFFGMDCIYEQHGHESGSDSEAKHKRHRRDRDGTRRNGAAEELEDGELGEDGEIR